MDKSEIDPRILEQIEKLEQKYEVMGQDISSYLDGLLYSDYLTYWDYIHLDTLLSLQNPKTKLKDEMVFVIYHQITELYFKLILWEIDQIANDENLNDKVFLQRLNRIINYFMHLVHSFTIMEEGMEKDQFLKFRMALLPASGFQSAQYRMIEICSTDLNNLLSLDFRNNLGANEELESLFEKVYWNKGATELATGKKTLTLKQFDDKYHDQFIKLAKEYRQKNLLKKYQSKIIGSNIEKEIVEQLRIYDSLANISWPFAHFKSALRYLHKDPEDIKATGGTNWQKYLPPRFQKVVFFPELWTSKELDDWGKSWIQKELIPGLTS